MGTQSLLLLLLMMISVCLCQSVVNKEIPSLNNLISILYGFPYRRDAFKGPQNAVTLQIAHNYWPLTENCTSKWKINWPAATEQQQNVIKSKSLVRVLKSYRQRKISVFPRSLNVSARGRRSWWCLIIKYMYFVCHLKNISLHTIQSSVTSFNWQQKKSSSSSSAIHRN